MKNTIEYWKDRGITIFDELPEGWIICKNASTAPDGYVWICNNKSFFDGTRKHGLMKEDK